MPPPSPSEMHQLYLHAITCISGFGPGAATERVGPLLCCDAGLGVSTYNIAMVAEAVLRPREVLRQAMEWFALRGTNLRLDLRAGEDGRLLAASVVEGFTFWWRSPAMVLFPLPGAFAEPAGLDMRPVTDATGAGLYAEVDFEDEGDRAYQQALVANAAQLEGVSIIVGTAGGQPVARSMAVSQGGLTGVFNVFVAPAWRGKGFGKAMTAAAIEAGRASGAIAACLQATAEGVPVYRAMGFTPYDEYVTVGVDSPRT